ncbi:hypothetical protein DCO44_01415 [Acinetobacter sp. AM]|nr:hypothetical protein DCO44_01415 [Acinetobacter sp. AM]
MDVGPKFGDFYVPKYLQSGQKQHQKKLKNKENTTLQVQEFEENKQKKQKPNNPRFFLPKQTKILQCQTAL